MDRRYAEDPLTIILCVIAANSDIVTSDGLMLAKGIDATGSRAIIYFDLENLNIINFKLYYKRT